MKSSFARFVACGFGSGFSPVVPGTAGSAACCLVWWIVSQSIELTALITALSGLAITALGVIAIHFYLKVTTSSPNHRKPHDPSEVVIDEWAGMLFALCPVASGSILGAIIAFFLFRIFDVLKPGPVGWAEKLPGAWGVMLDDCIAGIFAAGCVWMLQQVGGVL